MDSQTSNLYETASQPDTGNDAYTFLEFNTQGGDDDDFVGYHEFDELSQPQPSIGSSPSPSSSVWPTPSDSVKDSPAPAEAQPSSAGKAAAAAASAVDALSAGMSG